jgi:UDP-GlcNAc:undecaprenyl-phosphate GlcNAc-1-phosphate transferase
VPLLGGCAIFLAVLLPSLLALAVVRFWAATEPPAWLPDALAVHIPGAAAMAPTALYILAAAFVLHVVGIIDDKRNLGPWLKLIVQTGVATGLVLLAHRVRVLTVAGEPWSAIATVLWLVTITNAFNFMDNMDGLSAGVALICAVALLGAAAVIGQIFVGLWLCLLIGALAGFLPYNFSPASTFMGDAGSLVIGFLLAVLSCLTTYTPPGHTYYLYGVFVPVVLMALPIYDMVSVITLRLRDRRNPMVGDRRHFSHRLVRRGMNVRTAVLTIYLCTAGTAIAASLLPRLDNLGAIMVFCQTVIILLIVALLEMGEN